MKKLIVVTFLFIFIISVKCYAQEQVPVMTSSQLGIEVKSKCTSGEIANVINDSDNPVENYLIKQDIKVKALEKIDKSLRLKKKEVITTDETIRTI